MSPVQHIYKHLGSERLFYAWFASMHTRVDIILSNRDEDELVQITESIYKRLNTLEKIGNYFNPSSELSIVNNAGKGVPTIVSKSLLSMIEMCIYYNQKTDGYFDISIDSDHHSADTLKNVLISKKDLTITLNKEGIKLNLSGFIKGYALDETRKILETKGIDNALINIGNSSVLALGNHPLGDGWKVGIDFPTTGGNREIVLNNECLTTSGNNTAQRKHIKSPYSGEYIEGIRGISVITDSAAEGEALSTALFAAEPEKRAEILKQFKATVYNL